MKEVIISIMREDNASKLEEEFQLDIDRKPSDNGHYSHVTEGIINDKT